MIIRNFAKPHVGYVSIRDNSFHLTGPDRHIIIVEQDGVRLIAGRIFKGVFQSVSEN